MAYSETLFQQVWQIEKHNTIRHARPLAGYGLPLPRGNFVDHIFLEAQCIARILQHISPRTMAALSCNSLLCNFLGLVLAIVIPPPRENFVHNDFKILHYIIHILKYVSPLRVAALAYITMLRTLPAK